MLLFFWIKQILGLTKVWQVGLSESSPFIKYLCIPLYFSLEQRCLCVYVCPATLFKMAISNKIK